MPVGRCKFKKHKGHWKSLVSCWLSSSPIEAPFIKSQAGPFFSSSKDASRISRSPAELIQDLFVRVQRTVQKLNKSSILQVRESSVCSLWVLCGLRIVKSKNRAWRRGAFPPSGLWAIPCQCSKPQVSAVVKAGVERISCWYWRNERNRWLCYGVLNAILWIWCHLGCRDASISHWGSFNSYFIEGKLQFSYCWSLRTLMFFTLKHQTNTQCLCHSHFPHGWGWSLIISVTPPQAWNQLVRYAWNISL